MPEFYYLDENGDPQDAELWAEVLGEDAQMTWHVDHWHPFVKASNPDDLWPRLLEDATRLGTRRPSESNVRERSYAHSYPALVSFLAREGELASHDVIVAANAVYAWMPRVATLEPAALEAATQALNRARRDPRPASAVIDAVKTYLGGSLTGASKLLHFAAPSVYAIWDSRVSRYLGGRRIGMTVEEYLCYLGLLRDLLSYPGADTLEALLWPDEAARPTRMRQVEYIMFAAPADA